MALLSLIGLPATLGFVTRFTAYSGLEADLPALIVALLGETFVVAAIIRMWVWAEPRPLPGADPDAETHRAVRWLIEAGYLAIFALATVVLAVSPAGLAGRYLWSMVLRSLWPGRVCVSVCKIVGVVWLAC